MVVGFKPPRNIPSLTSDEIAESEEIIDLLIIYNFWEKLFHCETFCTEKISPKNKTKGNLKEAVENRKKCFVSTISTDSYLWAF